MEYTTCIKARVVATWKSYHDLPLVLHHLVVGDAVLPQYVGADHAHLVPQVS